MSFRRLSTTGPSFYPLARRICLSEVWTGPLFEFDSVSGNILWQLLIADRRWLFAPGWEGDHRIAAKTVVYPCGLPMDKSSRFSTTGFDIPASEFNDLSQ